MDLLIENLQNNLKSILEHMDYLTVLLCGSKSLNLSHSLSDTDVLVLIGSTCMKDSKYEECELKIVTLSDLDKTVDSVLNSERLSVFSEILLSNIYHGKPIIKPEVYDDIKQKIPWDKVIRNMVSDRLRGYEFYKRDACKFKNTGDLLSARFCYQRAIDNLIDAYLFSNSLLIVKDKWRIKSLEKLDNAFFKQFIIIYLDIWRSGDIKNFSKKFDNYCEGIFEFINVLVK